VLVHPRAWIWSFDFVHFASLSCCFLFHKVLQSLHELPSLMVHGFTWNLNFFLTSCQTTHDMWDINCFPGCKFINELVNYLFISNSSWFITYWEVPQLATESETHSSRLAGFELGESWARVDDGFLIIVILSSIWRLNECANGIWRLWLPVSRPETSLLVPALDMYRIAISAVPRSPTY
jgi:hypothetical protein